MDKPDKKLYITDLSLVPDIEFLDEIQNRWDDFVFAGIKENSPEDDGEPHIFWDGNDIMCKGLCQELLDSINTIEYEEDDDDDERPSDIQCEG